MLHLQRTFTQIDDQLKRPALVLCGIGSFGCQTLDIFAAMLKSEFAEVPKNVQMLGIETDRHAKTRMKNPDVVDIVTLPALPREIVQTELDRDDNSLTCEMLHPDVLEYIHLGDLEGGAANVPQIGHYGFYKEIGSVRSKLREKVDKANQHKDPADELFVCVVGSACGGTASGIFVPIGALLTNILASKGTQPRAIVAIPATNYEKTIVGNEMVANAVATLYTLEHFSMEDFEVSYAPQITIASKGGEGPYDSVQLLSYKDAGNNDVRDFSEPPVEDIKFLQRRARRGPFRHGDFRGVRSVVPKGACRLS